MIISIRSNRELIICKGWVISFSPKNHLVSGPGLVGGYWSTRLWRILDAYSLLIFLFKSITVTDGKKYLATTICLKQLDEKRKKERSWPFSWSTCSRNCTLCFSCIFGQSFIMLQRRLENVFIWGASVLN